MKVLEGLSDIIEEFDGFAVDQWGVLHDGRMPYPGVIRLLDALAAQQKDVLVITNSSKTAARNMVRLDRSFAIVAGIHYRKLVSSAQLLHDALRRTVAITERRVCVISASEDTGLLDDVADVDVTPLDDAELVVLLSVPEEPIETLLPRIADRALEVIVPSADEDSVTPLGLTTGLAPWVNGLLGLGVNVRNLGKPSTFFYEACQAYWTGGTPPGRILAIGDQLKTDVVGAKSAGWSSALVQTGAGSRTSLRDSDLLPDYLVPSFRL